MIFPPQDFQKLIKSLTVYFETNFKEEKYYTTHKKVYI